MQYQKCSRKSDWASIEWNITVSKGIMALSCSQEKKKLHGLSPRANYTDRATAACRRSDSQLVRIEGATWSA
jgi:hypothetical protein